MELLDEVQMAACIAYSKLDGLAAAADAVLRVPRHRRRGVAEQAAQAEEIAAGYERARLPLGHRRRRAQQAVAGAARRLLGGAGAEAGPSGHRHRRDRADLAPGRGDPGRQGGHRRLRPDRADRRPCRRRQFPHRDPGAAGAGRAGSAPGSSTRRSSPARWRWAARAAASTASASASASSSKQEHGAEALAVMRSVKQALDPRGILNPGKMFLN